MKNRVIAAAGKGCTSGFSVLMVDCIPNLSMISVGQCFPLTIYKKGNNNPAQNDLTAANDYAISHGISERGLQHFQQAYPTANLSKDDIFYYVYGLLHSPDYRRRYADNLSKQLPRIPCVPSADFAHFSNAGRQLAELHLNYETAPLYDLDIVSGDGTLTAADYRVEKMRFAKQTHNGKKIADKTRIIYNHKITVNNIPLAAYKYVVNGKPALEWIMERQAITTDKKSGITNNANHWAIDTMQNPKYPLELLQRITTISLETMKIVNNLPPLKLPMDDKKTP